MEMSAVRAFVEEQLLGVAPPPAGRPLVGMAGTVTTLAAVARGIEPYDPATRARMRARRARNRETAARRLTALPLAERRNVPGLEPKRADVIPVGAAIVEAVLAWARADEVVVSDRGVRWGLALRTRPRFLMARAREGKSSVTRQLPMSFWIRRKLGAASRNEA